MNQTTGKIIIIAGVFLILVGLIIYFAGNKLHFLGRLPGDIRIDKENFSFYFPLTTCILISVAGTLLFKLIHWLLQR